jgi:multidrug efflux pump subunit AcrA (membrane-fusion protein)
VARWILLLMIVVLVLSGCGEQSMDISIGETSMARDSAPQPTPMARIATGKTVVADGQLTSSYPSLALPFGGGVSGEVLTITVKAGDVVQADDLLALIDETELQRTVDDAQRTLDRAIADRAEARQQWERDVADAEQSLAGAERTLATARLQYSNTPLEEARTNLEWAQQAEADAKKKYEEAEAFWPPIHTDPYHDAWERAIRDRELAEMRLADAEDVHSADYLGLEAREADVAQAEQALAALEKGIAPGYERAVEDAENELARAQGALEHARLVAPWAAIVLAVDVAPEATIGAGTSVVTLLNIEDGLRFVTRNLGEQHVADVYPGQRAVVTLRAFAEEPLEGTVEAVVPQDGEPEATNAHFTVFVRLSPTGLRLLPGLTGRVEIFTKE